MLNHVTRPIHVHSMLVVLAIAVLIVGADARGAELYSGRGYAAGSGPNDLVLVDLDGDGVLDAALPGKTGDHVAVALGQGDGSFGAVLTTPVGSNPEAIAAADFDGDGAVDLVTADAGDLLILGGGGTIIVNEPTSVSVLMGVGDGSFTAGVTLVVGTGPTGVETADVNGDAAPDLVVSDTIDDRIAVLLGNGDGTFQSPIWTVPTGQLRHLSVADLNGDLVEDLLVVSSDVEILLGNGDGTFTPASPLVSLITATSTEVSDVDSDGHLDILVFGLDPGVFSGGAVQVFFGDGAGSFAAMPSYQPLAGTAAVIAMGDLDGDGLQDLAFASSGSYFIQLGNGDGTFQPPDGYPLGGDGAAAMVVADVDSDGVADVLAVSRTVVFDGGSQILVGRWLRFFPGVGEGRFAAALVPGDLPPSQSGFRGLASGDLDGDALADLVDVVAAVGTSTPGWVGVRLGNGDGSFQAPALSLAGTRVTGVVVAELNADATPDVVVGNAFGPSPAGVRVLLGSGGGALHTAAFYAVASSPTGIAVGDVDGDSVADLVVSRAGGADVLLGLGDGTFGTATGFASPYGSVTDVALADFDGDSQLDILLASPAQLPSSSNQAVVLSGNGDGTFGSAVPVGADALSVAVADFDSDGNLDIALGSPSGSGSADVRILLGNGDGSFQPPTLLPTELVAVTTLLATDLDADGEIDLVAGHTGSDVSVFEGHGDGSFDLVGPFGVGMTSGFVTAADFDEDGLIDIASVGPQEVEIAVLLQIAAQALPVPGLGSAGVALLAGLMGEAARRRLRR